ncbi:MAG: hypothetical protein HYV63_07640 [Candidatus Schekmanbacteria bacterium]|nr:hypothetical protein [Candidatus Schekmanbacteria bacterium]
MLPVGEMIETKSAARASVAAPPYILDIQYAVALADRWHSGSGESRGAADRAVLRSADKKPMIMGSHVKGLLRNRCEQIALALGCEATDPHVADASAARRRAGFAAGGNLAERLFGTCLAGDCLFVDNLLPTEQPTDDNLPVLTRVSIDRALGRAKEHRLFITEHAAAMTLRGAITAVHAPKRVSVVSVPDLSPWPVEWSLLVAALQTLDRLGGDRSTGAGGCAVTIESLRARRGRGDWQQIASQELLRPLGLANAHVLFGRLEKVRTDRGPSRLRAICEMAHEVGEGPWDDPTTWDTVDELAAD